MTRQIREVQEFQLDGWTIQQCPEPGEDGFDLVHESERYHYDNLEPAVAAAQASPRFSPQHVQTVETVFTLHENVKYADFAQLIFKGQTVHLLVKRIKQYEKHLPSWAHGTPEDIDRWLHSIGSIPEDKLLEFYQWVGKHAISELFAEIQQVADNTGSAVLRQVAETWGDDVFPTKLPKGHPFCDVPHHTHTGGGGRLPTCRLDSEE